MGDLLGSIKKPNFLFYLGSPAPEMSLEARKWPFLNQTKSCQLLPVNLSLTPLSQALAHHDHWFAYYGVTRSNYLI